MIDDTAIKLRYAALDPVLDERGRRRFAAAEALAAGRGGVVAVSRITGIARSTIGRGLAELRGEAEPEAAPGRVRRKGGGRRPLVVTDPTLLTDLKDLVEPTTRGDPTAPLLWTAKSLRNLAAGLRELGHLLVTMWWPIFCAIWDTASRPIARPARGRTIPTAMPSLGTSIER